MIKITSNLFWILLITASVSMSCSKNSDNTPAVLSAPTVTVTPDAKDYNPGDTVTLTLDVDAPGKLGKVKVGTDSVTSFSNDLSVKGLTLPYVIPYNTPNGDLNVTVEAVDQQNPPKSTQLQVTLKVNVTSPAQTICDYTVDDATLQKEGWINVFEDDFNSDLSQWNIWEGGAFNNELELYQTANLSIQNGNLVITAKRESATGATNPYDATTKNFDFTSGRIESKATFSAGPAVQKVRIVARIKWPNSTGLWPAFWCYGDPWPTQGEIDILEARGQDPTKFQTNYFFGTSANVNLVQNASNVITANNDLTSCYHVYEMVWEQNVLTYYLDGKVVEVKNTGGYISQMFGTSQKIVLNLAVGGDFFSGLDPSTIQDGSMYIDYVKVFTSN